MHGGWTPRPVQQQKQQQQQQQQQQRIRHDRVLSPLSCQLNSFQGKGLTPCGDSLASTATSRFLQKYVGVLVLYTYHRKHNVCFCFLSRFHLKPGVEALRPLEHVRPVSVDERAECRPFLVNAAQHVEIEVATARALVPLATHLKHQRRGRRQQ